MGGWSRWDVSCVWGGGGVDDSTGGRREWVGGVDGMCHVCGNLEGGGSG